MRHNKNQRRMHHCLFGTIQARRAGVSEESWLQAAAQIRPRPNGSKIPARPRRQATGWYFIGETLRRNGNPRAVTYLREACRRQPWQLKHWLRLWQSTRLANRPLPAGERHG